MILQIFEWKLDSGRIKFKANVRQPGLLTVMQDALTTAGVNNISKRQIFD
jgi:hypothetical protein